MLLSRSVNSGQLGVQFQDYVNANFWSLCPFGLVIKTLASDYVKRQMNC
uniref:Predicted protein n=1 Tax=Hordeum vulgare subsp. vulgare TaxID=112509 RepID=F2DK21_HORVV|nr:predicted protein [Hordeum vulgare subsp. vulgare]